MVSKDKYGLKKLGVGAASVLLGTLIYGANNKTHADILASQSVGVTSHVSDSQNGQGVSQQSEVGESIDQVSQQSNVTENVEQSQSSQNVEQGAQQNQLNVRFQSNASMLNASQLSVNNVRTNFAQHVVPAQQIQLSSGYIRDLPKTTTVTSSLDYAKEAEDLFNQNVYQSDPVANTEKVDVDNLSSDQLYRINQYENSLVNQVREQFGLPDYVLNKNGINWEQGQCSLQAQNHQYEGHHTDYLQGAGENVAGDFLESSARPMHEIKPTDFHFVRNPITHAVVTYLPYNNIYTMDDLQAMCFYNTTNMLFWDAGMEANGHAHNFLDWNVGPRDYVAMGFEHYRRNSADDVLMRWVIGMPKSAGYNDRSQDLLTPTRNSTGFERVIFEDADNSNRVLKTETLSNPLGTTLTYNLAQDLPDGLHLYSGQNLPMSFNFHRAQMPDIIIKVTRRTNFSTPVTITYVDSLGNVLAKTSQTVTLVNPLKLTYQAPSGYEIKDNQNLPSEIVYDESQKSVNIQVVCQKLVQTVVQKVNYVDDVTGKVVKTQSISVNSNQSVPFKLMVPEHYVALNADSLPKSLKYTKLSPEVITVHLGHEKKTLTETKTVTRTIVLKGIGGNAQRVVQKANLVQNNVQDLVTGKINAGLWSKSVWPIFKVPVVKGYTSSIRTVPEEEVDGDASNQTIEVDYQRVKAIKPAPKLIWETVDFVNQFGQTVKSYRLCNRAGGFEDLTSLIPVDTRLKNVNDFGLVFGKVNGIKVVPVIDNVKDINNTQTVSRTINLVGPTGQVLRAIVQNIKLKRTGEQDLVTGKISWRPWSFGQFKSVQLPKTVNNLELVGENLVKADVATAVGGNKTVDVEYQQIPTSTVNVSGSQSSAVTRKPSNSNSSVSTSSAVNSESSASNITSSVVSSRVSENSESSINSSSLMSAVSNSSAMSSSALVSTSNSISSAGGVVLASVNSNISGSVNSVANSVSVSSVVSNNFNSLSNASLSRSSNASSTSVINNSNASDISLSGSAVSFSYIAAPSLSESRQQSLSLSGSQNINNNESNLSKSSQVLNEKSELGISSSLTVVSGSNSKVLSVVDSNVESGKGISVGTSSVGTASGSGVETSSGSSESAALLTLRKSSNRVVIPSSGHINKVDTSVERANKVNQGSKSGFVNNARKNSSQKSSNALPQTSDQKENSMVIFGWTLLAAVMMTFGLDYRKATKKVKE